MKIYNNEKERAAAKREIEKTAKEENVTEIKIISAMQAALAKIGDEINLELLSNIKFDYINKI